MSNNNLTRDLYQALSMRERGIKLVKWEATKAGAGMAFTGTACLAPLVVVFYFAGFELPMLAVASVMTGALGKACFQGWRVHRRRLGELDIIQAIIPLVETWRGGREISSRDRDQLHQIKELLFAQIVRYREEADSWRVKGRADKGAAYTALLLDLEDAKKLMDSGFVREEQEIRPKTPAKLEIEAMPLDQQKPKTSGLERFGRKRG